MLKYAIGKMYNEREIAKAVVLKADKLVLVKI
jgi:hypothetical protein